jgi:TolB protein
MKHTRTALLLLALVALVATPSLTQQDWIRTGTGLGVDRLRLAVPDFKPADTTAQTASLLRVFNDTLWYDLENAGIFDVVSKSFYPLTVPGEPAEVNLDAWGNPPPNAVMLAFGNLGVVGEQLAVNGWLFDVKNPQSPQVLGRQYREAASEDSARLLAHRFANEIIFRLGGGLPGVAESKIVFVSDRTGSKEIWMMDWDGGRQRRVTSLNSIALSPALSPDGSRIAFSSYARGGADIMMYSLELDRLVTFPRFAGTSSTPAWSPDGTKLAFTSSMRDDPEIFIADANGANPRRLTAYRGPDTSPVFNPRTGAQLAFVSGRSGLPQIYVMDTDGANLQRLTDGGYAVSPSWSPNGQFLAFSWMRRYGPGAPGAQDIYVMDIASRRWVQLTFGAGRNDSPSWSPDGRHIVFQSTRSGREQIWVMLADGSRQRQLTSQGRNTQPSWSFR